MTKQHIAVAFLEAMQANIAQSSNPSQADMDEAIRKQKELEEMCAQQRQMLLLYQERGKMESVLSSNDSGYVEVIARSKEGSTGHVRKQKIAGNVGRDSGPSCLTEQGGARG